MSAGDGTTDVQGAAWLEPLDGARRGGDDDRLVLLEELRQVIVESDAALDRDVRRAAFGGGPVPEALATYVEKVWRHAYKVTDEDVADLRAAGLTEEQIFELTVATAVGAGYRRLHAGLRALGDVA